MTRGSCAGRLAAVLLAAGLLAACETAAPQPFGQPFAGDAEEGARIAEALCSGCHATTAGALSPNPEAPSFVQVANTTGLTERSLGAFLEESHNFPERMNFEIVPEDADALAAYIITLREADYSPPIQ